MTGGDNKCQEFQPALGPPIDTPCCPQGFTAVPGWDPASGWGSVDYEKLKTVLDKLDSAPPSSPPIGAIVGGTIGGVVFVGVIVALVWFMRGSSLKGGRIHRWLTKSTSKSMIEDQELAIVDKSAGATKADAKM